MGHSVLYLGARDSLSLGLLQFRAKVTGNGFKAEGVQEHQDTQEYLRMDSRG
jgi:hypothetical protein